MANKKIKTRDIDRLRRQAEKVAGQKEQLALDRPDLLSPAELKKILHELKVHQIELEMQNEDLRQAQNDLEKSRERYFSLYDLAPVGYATLSQKGLLIEANLTTARLLGVERSSLIKQPISRFILKDDQDIYYLHRQTLFESGQSQICELRMLKKDETIFWARLEAVVTDEEEGAPVCRVIISDITEHKLAESKTIEIEALKAVNLAKSNLLANVSHELRTPLASIKGFIETLIEPDITWSRSQEMEFLRSANYEVDRLTLLIKDLLDMSRIDSGKLVIDSRTCQVQEILDSAAGVLMITTLKNRLHISLPLDMPAVQADKTRIIQVLTNLVENAVKFSPAGSDIEIEAVKTGDWVIISVADHGIGMSPEVISNLFNRFYQAEQLVVGKTRGTGLGLSICKGIIEAHGGKIWAESQIGQGSRFTFSLPANRRSAAQAARSKPAAGSD